jgi:predicted PurR-regulated permease PerM
MISNRRLVLVWLALLTLALTYWVIVTHVALIMEIGWVLLGAMLLSLAIRPLADRGQTWHIPKGVTTIAIYIALVAIVILVGSLVTPIVRAEITQLQQNGPQLWQQIQQRLADTPFAQWLPSTDSLVQSLGQRLDSLAVTALGTVTSIGGLLLDFLLLFILAFFFVTDSGWGGRFLFSWIPTGQQPRVAQFLANISHQLTRWVWAQLGLAIYFGLAFTLVLTILQVPFALTIGLVGGLLEFIPYLGGLVALTLGIFTALTVSPATALWLILLYTAVTLLEGHVIAPFLYGRAIGLRSAVVLVALFVGAKAAGVLGVFFAVPVTVILTAVVQEGRAILLTPEAGT